MSLLTTPTLRSLYNKARKSTGLEYETINFWSHMLSRIYFNDEYFVVNHQNPPSSAPEERLRRVDFSIGRIDFTTDELAIIAFVEGKRTKAGERDYKEVEAQCLQACEAHVKHYPNCYNVYGICVVGTEAQIFIYQPRLLPRHEFLTHGYIDANSSAASKLHELFNSIAQSAQPPTLGSTTGQYTSGYGQGGYGGQQSVPGQQYTSSYGQSGSGQGGYGGQQSVPGQQYTSSSGQQQSSYGQQYTSGYGQSGSGQSGYGGQQSVPGQQYTSSYGQSGSGQSGYGGQQSVPGQQYTSGYGQSGSGQGGYGGQQSVPGQQYTSSYEQSSSGQQQSSYGQQYTSGQIGSGQGGYGGQQSGLGQSGSGQQQSGYGQQQAGAQQSGSGSVPSSAKAVPAGQYRASDGKLYPIPKGKYLASDGRLYDETS